MTAFSTLNVLPAAQLDNLIELGYLTMTPVQAAALPAILEGRDVRVQAKTGSGKTAAFGLGLLQHIDAALFQTQSLVLCPTRELADQVAGELRRLARFLPNTKILTLCGGQPFGAQRDSLQHAPHIIVATPGRLLDHLQRQLRQQGVNRLLLEVREGNLPALSLYRQYGLTEFGRRRGYYPAAGGREDAILMDMPI